MTAATNTAAARARRWPRRLAIGAAVTATLLGGAYWFLGREATLQQLAERVAKESGGSIVITGVTGSLYSSMHLGKIVFRSPEKLITADNVEIDWSPFQYLTRGIAINRLHVMALRVDTLRDGEPLKMPATLAAPFLLELNDARINKVTLAKAGVATIIADVRFDLHGDKQKWKLQGASAITPWGYAKADGSIAAHKPFKLDAAASLTQLVAPKGQKAAQLDLRAGGDLLNTQLAATGQSGKASGDAQLIVAPFDAIPLRQMAINGKHLDPAFFNPGLPSADLSVTIASRIDANRDIKGSVNIENAGAVGTIDKLLLPLRAMHGDLAGNLDALAIKGAVINLGGAGKFTGSGSLVRVPGEPGLGTAQFVLHTDRLDLRQVHSRIKETKIAGDIRIVSKGKTQTLTAQLAEAGMRLDAEASLENQLLQVRKASISAGGSSVRLTANASLAGTREFKVNANAVKFNPASFGDYPAADINADINAHGFMSPAMKLAASFALRPSRLFDQSLSGSGKFNADASHISGVSATLALGANTADLRGSFGAPGEKLLWRIDGKQLAAVRKDLYGTIVATGAVTGTMAAPRTSFEVDAKGLGWTPATRAANAGALHASGDAWLTAPDKDGKGVIEATAKGTAQGFNPAAFGSFLPGSINGSFDAGARLGPDWRGTLNLALQPSTLASSPFWGYAKLAADAQHVSNADVNLHLGPNVVAAKGSFGAGADVLDWRIDAPQLGALGPNFGGALRGTGSISGSMEMPSLKAALEGQNLKFSGQQLKSVRASGSLGAGRGAADPLVSDVEITGYASGDTKVDAARLQTAGTRGAHTLRFSARNDTLDAGGEVQGGWNAGAWTGTVASLQNKGPYAFALQGPVALRISGAPGSGVIGLLNPNTVSLRDAVIKLPNGTVSLQSLDKDIGHWTSKGAAAGVPLHYLAQFSPAMRDSLRGDLTIGGQWALDMQGPASAGGPPSLSGMLRVFREKGDLIAGADVPVALGLRVLDLRADIVGGALRTQVEIDGTRTGRATIDATAQLVQGRVSTASPLKLVANADMTSIAWLAPFAGQPGLELDGALKLALTGAGTIGVPTLNGTVNGDNLAVRWAEQGIKLRNGQLRAQLAGDQMLLQRLSFDGPQGRASADGAVRFTGGEATMQLKLVADKLEILSRPDRTLVVSGESTLVRDNKHFHLDGKFRAERAMIELAPQGRPTLSDDVIVLGRNRAGIVAKPTAPAMPLSYAFDVDLGDAFRLRGLGIDAELAGKVSIHSSSRGPRANGGIRVTSGTYKAYGQNLFIERGVLTFSGPYDNPALNIRAVRRRPEGDQLSGTNVEAGVEVRGTALSPVAKLVSTPNVPDSEKLAWLVLGHSMDAVAGNEAGVLTAAAGALLGGKGGGIQSRIASTLGLDEVGLSQAKGLESTVLTVGKRLSSRAFLSFEQGATSASSLVKLRYKLNNKFTLQFQAGTNTALDVLYSWAFD
ncbi:MAG: translocation/assembly module TamB domain-containing protein [Pseudomonadota bacterium]